MTSYFFIYYEVLRTSVCSIPVLSPVLELVKRV